MSLITFDNVSRIYENGDHKQKALDHVNMSLEEGKFVVILGPSGAGKSTLLNLLGGLDSPTEGKITVNGKTFPACPEMNLPITVLPRSALYFSFTT